MLSDLAMKAPVSCFRQKVSNLTFGLNKFESCLTYLFEYPFLPQIPKDIKHEWPEMLSHFLVIRMQCIIGDSTIWIRIGYGPKGILWTVQMNYFLREQWKNLQWFYATMVLKMSSQQFWWGSQGLLVALCIVLTVRIGGIDHLMKLMLMDKTTRTWMIAEAPRVAQVEQPLIINSEWNAWERHTVYSITHFTAFTLWEQISRELKIFFSTLW